VIRTACRSVTATCLFSPVKPHDPDRFHDARLPARVFSPA
jgi:hypothetical protein